MATIQQEVNDAALECGIARPASWLGTTNDARMMQAMLRAVVGDILERHAWTGSSVTATFTPAVETSLWPLPAGFNRLQEEDNAVFEVNPNRRPMIPMVDDGDWSEMVAWGSVGAQRYYRRTSAGIEFYRPLPPGSTVKIAYLSDNWIVGGKSEWTDEPNDIPVFPSQLIRFGLISRWSEQKGLTPRAQQASARYEAILARAIGDDRPRRIIRTEGPGIARAHPMRVPVPDFIPSGS